MEARVSWPVVVATGGASGGLRGRRGRGRFGVGVGVGVATAAAATGGGAGSSGVAATVAANGSDGVSALAAGTSWTTTTALPSTSGAHKATCCSLVAERGTSTNMLAGFSAGAG
jgi:hypothetical protein